MHSIVFSYISLYREAKFYQVGQLCEYAHKYFAKVYLTLNTILYESELEQTREMIVRVYNIGCDAVIVQDMALLEMDLPPIPLFASTQTEKFTGYYPCFAFQVRLI
jgi:putative protease